MLHLITEENAGLKNRRYRIPFGIRKKLKKIFQGYEKSDHDKTAEGYIRLKNLLNTDTITYNEMRRIKNFFDSFQGDPNNDAYKLNGGQDMMFWVDNMLSNDEKALKDAKKMLKDNNVNNMFIKKHEKTSISNNVTMPKMKHKEMQKSIADNEAIKFESI